MSPGIFTGAIQTDNTQSILLTHQVKSLFTNASDRNPGAHETRVAHIICGTSAKRLWWSHSASRKKHTAFHPWEKILTTLLEKLGGETTSFMAYTGVATKAKSRFSSELKAWVKPRPEEASSAHWGGHGSHWRHHSTTSGGDSTWHRAGRRTSRHSENQTCTAPFRLIRASGSPETASRVAAGFALQGTEDTGSGSPATLPLSSATRGGSWELVTCTKKNIHLNFMLWQVAKAHDEVIIA